MPRGKKNTPAAESAVETVVETAKIEEVPAPVEAAAEKKTTDKPAAKKTAAKKTAAKKTTKKDTAKTAEAKTSKASKANVFIQYAGIQVTADELVDRAKAVAGVKSPKNVNIYVKPEDNKVYYVVDDNAGDFELA